jgi:hypothetical protein
MRNFILFPCFLLFSYFHLNGFTGCLSGNCYEGYGVYIYPSGGRYEGEFERANPNGKGKLLFPNGDLYIGEWVNSYRQGVGILYMKNGDEYEGGFLYSKFHGVGKYKYVSGDTYQGNWKLGSQHGFGIYKEASGAYYEGSFAFGKMEGVGKKVFTDGSFFQGQWQNGTMNGNGKLTLPDGKVLIGIWENNEWKSDIPQSKGLVIQMEVTKTPKIRALILGVSDYNLMKKLEFSDDDAQHIYDFLKSEAGGAVPSNQIVLLKDQQATQSNILKAANDLFMKADPDDFNLFYFSGHGLPGAFIPVDSDGEWNRISHQEIKKLLLNSQAKYKMVIADACHSGSFKSFENRENISHLLYESIANASGGLGLFLSSRTEEFSHEFDGIKSGVFSHFLIKGLKGEAEINKDGFVSVNELFDYVYEQVRYFTQNKQSPVLLGTFDKNMPVSVVR